MKILALHLGGTIACAESNGTLSPKADITGYFKEIARNFKGISFIHKRYAPFLSEHLNGALINRTVKDVIKAQSVNKFDGIILTHGSDTLPYISCALAYALGNECIPTVTVCADLPLSNSSSTGHLNLRAATALIACGQARGVFSAYQSTSTEVRVYRASRLLRHRAYESELSAVGEDYGKVSFIAPANAVFTKNPDFEELNDEQKPLTVKLSKACPICVIQVYPSMPCIRPPRHSRAVVLSTYHSGTLDTKNPQIRKLAAICKRRGIPIFADGIGANSDYESMDAYGHLGITRLPPLTSPIAMLIKLWALISSKDDLGKLPLSLGGDITSKDSKSTI